MVEVRPTNREHQAVPTPALATLLQVLSTFRLTFTRPGFAKFLVFAAGWILTQGPLHCMTEALVATDVARRRHWAAFHRFFSCGTWNPDRLGFWLLQRLRSGLATGPLRLVVDDTLCPKKGPEVFGLLAAEVRSRRSVAAYLAIWATVSLPTPPSGPRVEIAVSLARAAVIYAFLLWVTLRRETASLDAPELAGAAERGVRCP
ncbi:MAG: transposase [Minicystis sp.]